jgi:hypothetical protein
MRIDPLTSIFSNTCYCTGDDIFPDVSNVATGTGSVTQPCPASEGLVSTVFPRPSASSKMFASPHFVVADLVTTPQATRIPTDFQFVDCFRDTTGTGITHIGFVATPQACFDACNLFPQAFYNVLSASGVSTFPFPLHLGSLPLRVPAAGAPL